MFETLDDIEKVHDSEMKYLPHRYYDGCLVKRLDSSLICRKLDNIHISPNSTNHQFMSLPNECSMQCLRNIERTGMIKQLDIDDYGNVIDFKSILPLFYPQRYILPTNPTNNMNISPVEGHYFCL